MTTLTRQIPTTPAHVWEPVDHRRRHRAVVGPRRLPHRRDPHRGPRGR
ncbi:hypothetical protein [Nocardioides convexus]|nr:hypothetical protein [Nocardioides convexus]